MKRLAFEANHTGIKEFTSKKIKFWEQAPLAKRSALTLCFLAIKEMEPTFSFGS